MYDPFSISLEKTDFHLTKTADDRDLGYIRWGMFEASNGERKIAAFYVPMLDAQFAHMAGKNLVSESNAVAERTEAQEGPARQAYEWAGQEFLSVEPDQQSWFSFK